jgi:hypothetical protein
VNRERFVIRQRRRYLDAGATDVVISPLDRSEPLTENNCGGVLLRCS